MKIVFETNVAPNPGWDKRSEHRGLELSEVTMVIPASLKDVVDTECIHVTLHAFDMGRRRNDVFESLKGKKVRVTVETVE